jgi:hypothetical protein
MKLSILFYAVIIAVAIWVVFAAVMYVQDKQREASLPLKAQPSPEAQLLSDIEHNPATQQRKAAMAAPPEPLMAAEPAAKNTPTESDATPAGMSPAIRNNYVQDFASARAPAISNPRSPENRAAMQAIIQARQARQQTAADPVGKASDGLTDDSLSTVTP